MNFLFFTNRTATGSPSSGKVTHAFGGLCVEGAFGNITDLIRDV